MRPANYGDYLTMTDMHVERPKRSLKLLMTDCKLSLMVAWKTWNDVAT